MHVELFWKVGKGVKWILQTLQSSKDSMMFEYCANRHWRPPGVLPFTGNLCNSVAAREGFLAGLTDLFCEPRYYPPWTHQKSVCIREVLPYHSLKRSNSSRIASAETCSANRVDWRRCSARLRKARAQPSTAAGIGVPAAVELIIDRSPPCI